MKVGVPKEIKVHEYRIGMTPSAVRELIVHGHKVMVQKGGGAAIGLTDEMYAGVGAELVDGPAEIFARADMIVKVKEPQASEWPMIRKGQTVFTYFHFAADRELMRLQKGDAAHATSPK